MSLSFVAFVACEDKENSSSNGGSSVYKSGTQDGHDYVDLGLPSGTLWATCNVGASKPQDYGNYYAWGETTTKGIYGWSTYKYGTYNYDGDYSKLTKYNESDRKTTLDLEDDAAYVNWGGKWRTPTYKQAYELRSECVWVWTNSYNNSNVAGYIVYKAKAEEDKGAYEDEIQSSLSYSLSDAHIFRPAAGDRRGDVHFLAGEHGYYWYSSSSLSASTGDDVNFTSDGVVFGFPYRCYGESVRAVISGE